MIVIYDLCHFFKVLCGKALDLSDLDKLEKEVAMTLCELEKMFLLSFFIIMIHLINHLIHKVRLVDLFSTVGCIPLKAESVFVFLRMVFLLLCFACLFT